MSRAPDERSPWSGGATVTVRGAGADWHALASAAPPVLYSRHDTKVLLHAGGGEWHLAGSRLVMVRPPDGSAATVDLMYRWWRRTGGDDAAHAIATALLYRCYLVTASPEVAAAAGRLGVEALDLTRTWD